jgi:hypothetical protein
MVLIDNNNTNSNNMFHSFLGTYLELKNTLKPFQKETWEKNLYNPKDMQALGLKSEAPVLNGYFRQREKCPFPCYSVMGMFHPAKYPYPSCSGVHSV